MLEAVAAARAALRAGGEDGDGIASATADLLTALADHRLGGWGERWGTAADRFDRAARTPGGHPPEPGPVAGQLRLLARSLLTARGRAGRGRGRWGGVGGGAGRAGGRDRRLAGRPRPRPPGRRGPPQRYGRDRARPRAPARGTVGAGAGGGWEERPGTGHATAAGRVGAIRPPAEQRAHHDPIDWDPSGSVVCVKPGAVVWFGTGRSAHAVGGSVVTDRQEQAVLAVVRLIGDQDVEVTAQHASSTSAAVTVRIGRALLYLNDQATAAHFHKVWFDAAAHARTLPPVGHPAHRGLVRALRGMPEPGVVANASARPACSVAMVGGDPPDAKPFLRVQLGRVAFEIRDFAAYRSCLGAFRQAHHMARDVFLPAGSARVYNGALTAARDAFYPHTPDAPDPPANRPGTARGRRVAQTTDRSAPITPAAPRHSPAGASRQSPSRSSVRGQTA